MRLVDTHCHLQDEKFADDLDEVIDRSLESLAWVVIACDDLANGQKAASITRDRIYAMAGFHPYHAAEIDSFEQELRTLLAHPNNVALGEIGLDYFKYCDTPREVQERSFRRQLEIALELNKPVVIHDRDAHDDCYRILKDYAGGLRDCVLHCFSAGPDWAEKFLALGFHLSFTCNVTYPNAQILRDAAAVVPMDRIMVETDGPYLPPQPLRGKRCEPAYVEHAARTIAGIKDMYYDDFVEQSTRTAENFFGVKGS